MKYSSEKNALILLAALKEYGISRVVASPGGTNVAVVASLQYDDFFTVYSAVDERHAAYLACGIATETGEPVVLSCTGATASRNYLPGLTEAYYRKLPILVVTSSQRADHTGNLYAQMTDRSCAPNDAIRYSASCPVVATEHDSSRCEEEICKAILELSRHGGGPVHLNLEASFSSNFSITSLPKIRKLERIDLVSVAWPQLNKFHKIAVWIGAHVPFSIECKAAIDEFSAKYGAIVLCDHTSSYCGPNAISSALICAQSPKGNPKYDVLTPDLIIHIGEVSGDYPTTQYLEGIAPVWRVSPDGEFRNRLSRLQCVFEMPEQYFFSHYLEECQESAGSEYQEEWKSADRSLRESMPEIPFSNIWINSRLSDKLPSGCVMHMAINNSLRSRNFFPLRTDIATMANVGAFGIDGCISSLIGASFCNKRKLYFGVTGDLSFFYDLNSLGNRHIGRNLRIIVVNNGAGAEFNNYSCHAAPLGKDVNKYIAAGGHFGDKSATFVRHIAEDLGFHYLSANNKESFAANLDEFVSPNGDKSIIFECFTDLQNESDALKAVSSLDNYQSLSKSIKGMVPSSVKRAIKAFCNP